MAEKQLIVCPSCGAKNRVDPAKVAQGNEPVCGSCKKPLPLSTTRSAGPVTVTDATFAPEVEQASLPVLLDLWAPWCGPCRMIAPMLEALAIELAGRVKIAKLNVDENPMTAGRLNVRSIPTLLLLEGGKEVDRIVGVMPKAELKQRVERSIAQSAAAGA
jgi:thioredoxin 2